MPFTFSHPAILLPVSLLPKRWYSATGLIMGSMVPDFEYFIRMKVISAYGHTFTGFFWFDIPLGLTLCFIFHNIVRDSLLGNLPYLLKSRLSGFGTLNWNAYFRRNWYIVLFSLIAGIASHLFWDAFTHRDGYFTALFPVLQNRYLLFPAGDGMPVYQMLQHISTLLGAFVIIFALYALPQDKSIRQLPVNVYWQDITLTTLVILTLRFLGGLRLAIYGDFIVSAIASFLMALVLVPLMPRPAADSTD